MLSLALPPVQPTLRTDRLVLRPFTGADAGALHAIVSDREIAYNTASIPHPYPEGMAQEWIAGQPGRWERGDAVVFAVTVADGGELAAAVGLDMEPPHRRAELGYWVARPFWNQGFASEAARAVVAWGFRELGLNRVGAMHYTRNPASGRVLRKIGMRHEGTLRQHVLKWGVFEDLEVYSILAGEVDGG